jgi:ABC-type Na+ efflux pump permease subunit
MRIGLGPVFAYEWLATSRRWQIYAYRVDFSLVLLFALWVVYAESVRDNLNPSISEQSGIGRAFYTAIVSTQLALVLLVTPAVTAGAICMDKARGTLLHVLMTDLSDAEIILGKLAARLVPALGIVLCGVPVMAASTLFGGVDPRSLNNAIIVILGSTILAAAIAILFSVWTTKLQEALMAAYFVLAVWILSVPMWWMLSRAGATVVGPPEWLKTFNPFQLALDFSPGSEELDDELFFFGGCLIVSALLVVLCVLSVRKVAIAHGSVVARRRDAWAWLRRAPRIDWLAWAPGPPLDANPVLWREWNRSRPSRWMRMIWLISGIGSAALVGLAVAQLLTAQWMSGAMLAVFSNGLMIAFGMLLLSIQAPSALAEERIRGSLDVLLSTPISTARVVWGKWLGAIRIIPWIAVCPLVLISLCVVFQDSIRAGTAFRGVQNASSFDQFVPNWVVIPILFGYLLAYGAALTSLGLALATWIPRVGRAIASVVAFDVIMTIGFTMLIALFVREDHGIAIAMGSPFMAGAAMTAYVSQPGAPEDLWLFLFSWGVFWIVFYACLAGVFLIATMATFERCVGRMPEHGERRVATHGSLQKAGPAPILASAATRETALVTER